MGDENMLEADAPVRVLVYESSSAQRHILSHMLEGANIELSFAENSASVIEQAGAGTFDILMTNAEHPDVSGFELCWSLRADADHRLIYILLVTSADDRRRYVEALDCGADDFLRKPYDAAEIRARLRSAERIIRMNAELSRLAETDPLTGAFNRRAFERRLVDERARAERYKHTYSLALIDIDHFKQVNDTYGHGVGDEALKCLVQTVENTIRKTDVLGRMGGEEFAILLPATDPIKALPMLDRVREEISEIKIQTDEGMLTFTASFGVAISNMSEESIEELFARADAALYLSKHDGRNRITLAAADQTMAG